MSSAPSSCEERLREKAREVGRLRGTLAAIVVGLENARGLDGWAEAAERVLVVARKALESSSQEKA